MMHFRHKILAKTPRNNKNGVFTSSELLNGLVLMLCEHDIDELFLEVFLVVGVNLAEDIEIEPHNSWIVELVVIKVVLVRYFSHHDLSEAIWSLFLGYYSEAEIRKEKHFFFLRSITP